MMKVIHPRVVALISYCLLAAAFSSSAQSNDVTKAATFANAPVTPSISEPKPSPDANSSAAESPGEVLAGSFSSAPDQTASNLVESEQTQANSQGNTQNQAPPSNNPQAPTLEDLGLSASQTQADVQLQARLDKRSHMLKIHQRLGLIATIPLIATVATSFGAGGRERVRALVGRIWRWVQPPGTYISPVPILRSLLPGFRGRNLAAKFASTKPSRGFMARA